MAKPHVVVAGGGLAGLSAAFTLLDSGAQVSLLEARPRLGGATWSFERNGLQFDNGQHVYLRCCTEYQRFLERIGTVKDAPIASRLSIPVLAPDSGGAVRVAHLQRSAFLPAPLHLMTSMLAYRHLSIGERLALGRAVFALRGLSLSDASLDDQCFSDFLMRHGQSANAIEKLWDLITLPTINVHASEASLLLAAMVFKTGLLEHADAGDIGYSAVPLNKLHVDPSVQLLERAGVQIRRRAKVRALECTSTPRHMTSVLLEDGRLDADAVVVAVPHDAAAELLPEHCIPEQEHLLELDHSPIIDVHLVYDRKVTDYALCAAVSSPVQFVFDRSAAAGLDPGSGQCLAISVSGADDEHGERPEALIERYSAAIVELFPRARDARLVDSVVTREHHATFRARPGTARLRAPSETNYDNVFLAGAWTDTGWPATMEGAVRSGVRAAHDALSYLGQHRQVPQLPEEVVA